MESPELPTAAQLREFVLQSDLNTAHLRADIHHAFDTFRTEMQAEFGRVHARFDAVDQRFGRLDERLLLHERTLLTTTRLAWLMAGLALALSTNALLR